jgi:anti-anti-sigma factor
MAVSVSKGPEAGAQDVFEMQTAVASNTYTAAQSAALTRRVLLREQAEPASSAADTNSVALLPEPATAARTHTLILVGELDRASSPLLEAEIERLCESGITGLTLDLRKLTHIDPTGVAVIVFRWGLCRKRGFDFALIPGSRDVQRAFERAGVIERLPFISMAS